MLHIVEIPNIDDFCFQNVTILLSLDIQLHQIYVLIHKVLQSDQYCSDVTVVTFQSATEFVMLQITLKKVNFFSIVNIT